MSQERNPINPILDAKESLIYYAYCQQSGKGYVGKTNNFQRRKYQHLKLIPPSVFHEAISDYGQEAFVWSILESDISEDIVDEREKYWIQEKRTIYPNGYNVAIGGQGGTLSEEAKAMRKQQRKQEEDERIANLNKDYTQDIAECPLCGQTVLFAYNHTVKPFKPIFNPLYTCACVFNGDVKLIFGEDK